MGQKLPSAIPTCHSFSWEGGEGGEGVGQKLPSAIPACHSFSGGGGEGVGQKLPSAIPTCHSFRGGGDVRFPLIKFLLKAPILSLSIYPLCFKFHVVTET